jgi:hypothetical protein
LASWCLQSNSGNYNFDNFVVKKFFADAGPSAITACEGVGVVIGGSSCPFPNATYSWTPAQYFSNPSSSNPTFTAPAGSAGTIQVTLTVSINTNEGVLGYVVAHTTSSTVDITIIQGSSITITGPTSVITGGSATLDLTDGTNYSWSGSDGSSGFSATNTSIITGPLTQDVTYTINAISNSGCSVTETITVTVTPLPAACVSDPNYPNTISIPNGTTDVQLIGMNLGSLNNNNIYEIVSKNFALEGALNLSSNTNIKFTNCHFYCFDASQIKNDGMLYLHRSQFEACNNMWKGIQNNLRIDIESCMFKDAEYAVHLKNGSGYKIRFSTFENNLYGILMGNSNGVVYSNIYGSDYKNTYENSQQLKPAYIGMAPGTWKPFSEAGIKIYYVNYVQIGLNFINSAPLSYANYFFHINNGIQINNSSVKVVNSRFKDITEMNTSTNILGLQNHGCGIFARTSGSP